ncbi:hypothetical protein [Novosphingobium lentum]|uniref:hypothetical protein n=1 Tax=Novosphingobium lentum TaxID=145287 RepID=UPI0012EE4B30|nr:hypothetical protein [Novosphingobium lentum]
MAAPTTPGVVDSGVVDPAWLGAALRQAGYAVDVESFDVSPVGTGQVGETYRYGLRYASGADQRAPATIIGKFHSSDAGSRAIARQLGLSRREYSFLFATPEGGRPVTIVDWQTLTFSYGVLDVAYPIGGAFAGDARREAEAVLLPAYYEALIQAGVGDLPAPPTSPEVVARRSAVETCRFSREQACVQNQNRTPATRLVLDGFLPSARAKSAVRPVLASYDMPR